MRSDRQLSLPLKHHCCYCAMHNHQACEVSKEEVKPQRDSGNVWLVPANLTVGKGCGCPAANGTHSTLSYQPGDFPSPAGVSPRKTASILMEDKRMQETLLSVHQWEVQKLTLGKWVINGSL